MSRVLPWREVRCEPLLDCRIFSVERSVAASPVDGSEHDYYRVRSGDWVQIIAITDAEEVVMVRQYRQGSSSVTLEIPGGLVDPGEAPGAAAIRECREETGYAVAEVVPMGSMNPNPAIHAHRLHSFYAYGARYSGQIQNTPTEITETELVPLDRIAEYLKAGRIDHCLVAATLWRFLAERG